MIYRAFQANDWQINKCLLLSLATLLAWVGLAGLACLGFDVPGLRQIIGFVFLTFIPGILILRILRIHNIGMLESLVFSVGLSLSFVMFSGVLLNFVLPALDISAPISLVPVIVSLAVFTVILLAAAYVRDRGFTSLNNTAPEEKIYWSSVLFLILLLLLTILGVTLIDTYQNNLLLLICLIAIAVVVGLAAFGKFIKPAVYPLAIFIIGLCLLYQTTLMSPYLIGSDIYGEYRFHQLVVESGVWDVSIRSAVNSCLSITILAPIYSLALDVDGVFVFKVIYPLLFSLVPLILFHVFSRQMSRKKAFLAAFFFVAVPTFSLAMIGLCRQQIAELFLALFILLIVDRKLGLWPKFALIIIFSISIIISHYSLGFIGMFYIGLLVPLVVIIRSDIFRKAWSWLTKRAGGLPRSLTSSEGLPVRAMVIVVVIYFVSSFAWYGATASGRNLTAVTRILASQSRTITTQFANLAHNALQVIKPDEPAVPTEPTEPKEPAVFFDFSRRDALIGTALGLDFASVSPQGKGFRVLQWITLLFLFAGFLRLVFRPKGMKFTAEYIALSLAGVFLLLACIFIPTFGGKLNIPRWYHIALITLAPFFVFGGEGIWLGASSLWRRLRRGIDAADFAEDRRAYIKFVTVVVLIPYFLFTSGIVYEITRQEVTDKIDAPYSVALSSYRLDLAGVFYWKDGAAAEWLAERGDDKTSAYADAHARRLLRFYRFPGLAAELPQDTLDTEELIKVSYIYFTSWNVDKDEITIIERREKDKAKVRQTGLRKHIRLDEVPGLIAIIDSKDRIYTNGGAQVLGPDLPSSPSLTPQ